jgi:hypothetical protein
LFDLHSDHHSRHHQAGPDPSGSIDLSRDRTSHLEMILTIADRMASNSIFTKRYCITIAAVFLVLASEQKGVKTAYLAIFPIVMMWVLDANFCWKELMAYKLYNKYRTIPEDQIDFDIDISQMRSSVPSWPATMFSTTLLIFYISIIAGIFIIDRAIN